MLNTDHDLIQRCLVLDDRAAFSLLVQKYQREIRAYLLRLTRNLELADDLAQETFLSAYRQLPQLLDFSKFRPWLYTIAHRQFLQSLRASKKDIQSFELENISAVSITSKAEVDSLLKTLRAEEAAALILCLAHDFTHAEAAEILTLPLGTVKSLILRSKEKLGALDEKI